MMIRMFESVCNILHHITLRCSAGLYIHNIAGLRQNKSLRGVGSLPHLELSNIFCVRWLCRILQKIQLSLKFCYSLLGLWVDNTHWWYPLRVYQYHSSVETYESTIAATCSNSSDSCSLWAASPCSFSVVWLNSCWTWWQRNTHAHTINIHTDKCLIHACVYANILVIKAALHTHTQKLLDLCLKLVSSWTISRERLKSNKICCC